MNELETIEKELEKLGIKLWLKGGQVSFEANIICTQKGNSNAVNKLPDTHIRYIVECEKL